MIKKTFIAFITLLFLVSVLFIGCDNNNNGSSQTVFTEGDFVDNPPFSADPEDHIVIKFLEHPNSGDQESDTGEIGNDVVPLNYKRTLDHTYCWDDDDQDAEHFMTIVDSEGTEILRLRANEECETVLIERGSYVMTIHHDSRIEEIHPIFIVPQSGLIAKNNNAKPGGILARARRVALDFFPKLDIGFTETTIAQTTPSITTILNTLMCIGCDFSGANLSNLNFSSVNFFTANLSNVNLTNTNLSGANLQNVNFTDTDLTVAILTSASLSNAIWTDGECRCTIQNSVGMCGGCPPCPCDFRAVPISTVCWGAPQISVSTFTSLSAGGCGLNGFDNVSGSNSQTMTVDTQTCQIIARDQACAQGVSNVLFPTPEEIPNCVDDIENYVRDLNSSGISSLDLPSFNCTP